MAAWRSVVESERLSEADVRLLRPHSAPTLFHTLEARRCRHRLGRFLCRILCEIIQKAVN
jgi:hypothetical protein